MKRRPLMRRSGWVAFALTGVLIPFGWFHSRTRSDIISFAYDGRTDAHMWRLISADSRIALFHFGTTGEGTGAQFDLTEDDFLPHFPTDTRLHRSGILLSYHHESEFGRERAWTLPYWLLEVGWMALATGLTYSALQRKRRRDHGLCSRCGYDLRPTPNGCPECGTVPTKPQMIPT